MTSETARRREMLREVREGLSRQPKAVPSVYFYDARGSQLFEEITRQPEYYLTGAERALLSRHMPALAEEIGIRALVELGAGSAAKTRVVLEAMLAAGTGELYVPVDVSADFLDAASSRLAAQYPRLAVRPAVADMTRPMDIDVALPTPTMFALLGSTLGNFVEEEAVRLLARVARRMGAGDVFLLGVDLRKDAARIEAAYNDEAGVTAEFNRNILRVFNRELGSDFAPERFRHLAFYDREAGRVEMHLVSGRDQTVSIPDAGRFSFAKGERIRTEISTKYDRAAVSRLFRGAGFSLDRWMEDEDGLYAIVLGSVAEQARP